jgi:hypothetical protein
LAILLIVKARTYKESFSYYNDIKIHPINKKFIEIWRLCNEAYNLYLNQPKVSDFIFTISSNSYIFTIQSFINKIYDKMEELVAIFNDPTDQNYFPLSTLYINDWTNKHITNNELIDLIKTINNVDYLAFELGNKVDNNKEVPKDYTAFVKVHKNKIIEEINLLKKAFDLDLQKLLNIETKEIVVSKAIGITKKGILVYKVNLLILFDAIDSLFTDWNNYVVNPMLLNT